MDYKKILSLAEKNKQENLKNAQKKIYSTDLKAPKRDPRPAFDLKLPFLKECVAQRSNNTIKSIGSLNLKKSLENSQKPINKHLEVKPFTTSLKCVNDGKTSINNQAIKSSTIKRERANDGRSLKNSAPPQEVTKAKKVKNAQPPLNYQELLKLAELKQKVDSSRDINKNVDQKNSDSSKSLERQMAEWRYRMHPPKKNLRPKELEVKEFKVTQGSVTKTANATLSRKPFSEKEATKLISHDKKINSKIDVPTPVPLVRPNGNLRMPPQVVGQSLKAKPALGDGPKRGLVEYNSRVPSNHHLLYCHKSSQRPLPKTVDSSKSRLKEASTAIKLPNGYHRISSGSHRSLDRIIPRHLLPANGRIPERSYKRQRYGDASESENEEVDEDESDLDSFVDDDADIETEREYSNYSKHIKEIFGYDKNKYVNERDDDIKETSFREQMKEEARSSRIGKLEDLEDIKLEKQMLMRKMQKK